MRPNGRRKETNAGGSENLRPHFKGGLLAVKFAVGDFLLGALYFFFELIANLQLIFDEFVQPVALRLQVFQGKPGESGLDFFDAAHAHTMADVTRRFKTGG